MENKQHSFALKEKGKKINISDYEPIRPFGIGSSARIILYKSKNKNKYYVAKKIKKYDIINQKQVDHIYSEYIILSSIKHPFIVQLKGAYVEDPKYLFLILEFVQGGELFTLLRSKVCFPLEQARFYAAHFIY